MYHVPPDFSRFSTGQKPVAIFLNDFFVAVVGSMIVQNRGEFRSRRCQRTYGYWMSIGECGCDGKRVVSRKDVLPTGSPVDQEIQGRVTLDLGCWWAGKRSIRLSSKFVSEVLLCLSEIELVDHVKFASLALFELADQKRV